jgi:hypothetical protein
MAYFGPTEREAEAQIEALPTSNLKSCLTWIAGMFGVLIAVALLGLLVAYFLKFQGGDPTPPAEGQAVEPPPAAAAGPTRSVVAPESAGGYERILEDTVKAGAGPQLAQMQRSGIRNPVTGWYHTPGSAPEPQVVFYGGVLAQTLADTEVAAAAQTRLDEAFRRLTLGGVRKYDGSMQTFEAGPLGGEVRCATLTSAARNQVVCGWVDRWTIGYIFDSRRNRTEAEVAALLVTMRADLEIVKS